MSQFAKIRCYVDHNRKERMLLLRNDSLNFGCVPIGLAVVPPNAYHTAAECSVIDITVPTCEWSVNIFPRPTSIYDFRRNSDVRRAFVGQMAFPIGEGQ